MSESKMMSFGLDAIFSEVTSGDFHASSHLSRGEIPLISCKTEKTSDHGVEGYFDIPADKTYEKCVTITCDGDMPSTAFYHPYRIAAKDNVLVCIPKDTIRVTTILYAIACLNRQRWRFSYGRKCYENKKDKLTISFPVDDSGKIDQDHIAKILQGLNIDKFLPKRNIASKGDNGISKRLIPMPITKLFDLRRGDFHNASSLPDGNIPLVSCGEYDNGVIRYCNVPNNKTYVGTLTIAHNGSWPLTTKYHPYRFAAKDDVAVCLPKKPLKASTLIFVQYTMNRQCWRYSYGRKCFLEKLGRLSVYLPGNANGEVDENAIEEVVSKTTYWNALSEYIS